MPALSRAQHRAMAAAAHGKSKLGIPAKVGREFVAATGSPKGLPERKHRSTGLKAVTQRHQRRTMTGY